VMPDGFAFPINNRIWTPLRLDPSDFERGKAPPIDVFGRLAPGASLADAQLQLSTVGRRLTATQPETHEHIRPRIMPYARAFLDSPDLRWAFHLVQVIISLLLVVIGTNVAILVYARTASRMGEIAVRSALGASRGRIVAQLFAEALVLSVAAAVVGLFGAWLLLRQIGAFIARMGGEQLPFWMTFRISPGMVVYVAGLAVLAAVIVGVLPALKATQRAVHANLQQLGGSAMRLGRTWTVLIVAQVAVAVAALPVAIAGVAEWVRQTTVEPQFATREFLTAGVFLDQPERPAQRIAAQRSVVGKMSQLGASRASTAREDSAYASRFAMLQSELLRRLKAEPGVADVVLASSVPGSERTVRIEIDEVDARVAKTESGALGHSVMTGRVGTGFFAAFDIPMLGGRAFDRGDVTNEASSLIVSRSFVTQVLGGREALGRRVRVVQRKRDANPETFVRGPWLEIVGVVPDYPPAANPRFPEPRMYQPMLPADGEPVIVAVRVRGGVAPGTFSGRLREVAVAVDPMLRLTSVSTLTETLHDNQASTRLAVLVLGLITLSVLLLSSAGIYAMISFTITRRRREIGIRAALGAGPRRLIVSVLSRAMRQIGIGMAVGIIPVGLIDRVSGGAMTGGRGPYLLIIVIALMGAVGIVASIGPARRALRIQPTEALRAE
jgi:putative ABC transport system permease protein